ncbi:hypothetical protein ACK3TF_002316 [Chlorella vulgaris]
MQDTTWSSASPDAGDRPLAATAPPGSTPASNPPTVPHDDADLDAAAQKLDQHSRQLRAEMLANLDNCKRRLTERHQRAAASAAASASAELDAKQQELDAAQVELARHQEVTRRVGHALFKHACWRRQRTLGSTVWQAWRAHTRRQSFLQTQLQAAAARFDLRRRALRAWRVLAARQLRPRLKAQAAAALHRERELILQEAQAAAGQQAQRLQEVQLQLGAAVAAREALAASTRAAFERGMSALNVEALSLAGDNPAGSQEGALHLQHQFPGAAGSQGAQQQLAAGSGSPIPPWHPLCAQHAGQWGPCSPGGSVVTGCAAPGSRVFLKRGTELTQPILSPIAPGQPVTVLLGQLDQLSAGRQLQKQHLLAIGLLPSACRQRQ